MAETETEIKKPSDMMEALEGARDRIEDTVINSFRTVREKHPDMSLGATLRMYHLAFIRSLQEASVTVAFMPTLGIIAKCLIPHLTEEEKEALRKDKLIDTL